MVLRIKLVDAGSAPRLLAHVEVGELPPLLIYYQDRQYVAHVIHSQPVMVEGRQLNDLTYEYREGRLDPTYQDCICLEVSPEMIQE